MERLAEMSISLLNWEGNICVPFRSNVNHKYAFHFKESKRYKKSKSELDYTKTIIIKDSTLQYFHDILGINDNLCIQGDRYQDLKFIVIVVCYGK